MRVNPYNKIKKIDLTELKSLAQSVNTDVHKMFGGVGVPGTPGYRKLTPEQVSEYIQAAEDRMKHT